MKNNAQSKAKKGIIITKVLSFVFIVVIAVFFYFAEGLIPFKVLIWGAMSLTVAFGIAIPLMFLFKLKMSAFIVPGICCALLWLLMVKWAGYYSYTHGSLLFWIFPLILSVIISTVTAILLGKKLRFWSCVGCFFAFLAVSFVFSASLLPHLNYILDFQKPQQHQVVIQEKDWRTRRRGFDDYELEFEIDGRAVSLDVSEFIFDQYEVGDVYPLLEYRGAFDVPFYLGSQRVPKS